MTAVDYFVLVIVGASILLSIWRGVVREVLALVSWIVAFLAAQAYAAPVAAALPAALESPALRLLAGFIAVFLLVLVLTALVTAAISRLVRSAGLGPIDRGLGAIFGLARGILVVVILVLLCGLTSLPRAPVWREAMLSPVLEAAANVIVPLLPRELARRISFD